MGIFDFLSVKENKNLEERSTNTSLEAQFNGYVAAYNEEQVLTIPTVKSCFDIISGSIAQLPIYLYRETEDNSVERITDDYRNKLLNEEPNEFQTAYNFKKQVVKDYLFRGASYNYIERLGNKVVEIVNLSARNIRVQKYIEDGFKLVKADINLVGIDEGFSISTIKRESKNTLLKSFNPYELFIALSDSQDGVTSKGVLDYGKEIFGVALEEKKYTSNIYQNGALPTGVLKSQNRLTKIAIENLRESWSRLYSGSKNFGKTVILEEGLDYSPISMKPSDLLLSDNRKDVVSDICKLFNLPESLVDVTKIKYGSLEQNNIHFLQYTLSPIISSIENGLNKSLLLEEEKNKGYFFAFDTSEVLRSTDEEKYAAAKIGLDAGVISINEARYKLNLPSIKDDILKWSLGAVLYYPETGEMKIPNMGIGIEGYTGNNANPKQQEANKNEANTNSNE